MLRKLKIENFRCFRRVEILVPRSGMLVLIGPNAAGKSTILEALDLLATATSSPSGLVEATTDRGGLSEAIHWGSRGPLSFGLELSGGPFELDGHLVEYELRLGDVGGRPQVLFEELRVRKTEDARTGMVVARADRDRRELRNHKTGEFEDAGGGPEQTIVSTVAQSAPYPTPLHLQEALASSRVYGSLSTAPAWLQTSFERSEGPRTPQVSQPVSRLHPRGLDLVNALRAIREDDPQQWDQLIESFTAEFPFVRQISFPPVPGGRQVLRWKHPEASSDLYLDQFSDGMIAYLCILAALHAGDRPAWIAFDEPENHLHPGLLRQVVGAMEARSERTPIIIATHSDTLLDYLSEPAETLCVVERGPGGSDVRHLNRTSMEAWLSEYRLSELRSRGGLESVRE